MLWEDNYLAHFGIKGQRWGIRRFQNEDGTLTAEGKERYLKTNDESSKEKAAQTGAKKAASDIRKITVMPNGNERNKAVLSLIKQVKESRQLKEQKANDAYNEALKTRDVSPRAAFNKAELDYDSTEAGAHSQKVYSWLFDEILKKSGDWYNNKPVSDGFRKNREELSRQKQAYEKREHELGLDRAKGGLFAIDRAEKKRKNDKILQDINAKCDRINDDLVSIVLKDINFPDTKDVRDFIRPLIFWD